MDTLEVTFCGHYTVLVYVNITSVEFSLFMPGLETITSLLRSQGHHEELEVPWDCFSLLALCILITSIDHSSSTFILISVTLITFEGITLTGRKMKLNVNLLPSWQAVWTVYDCYACRHNHEHNASNSVCVFSKIRELTIFCLYIFHYLCLFWVWVVL